MSVKEKFADLQRQVRQLVREGREDTIPYISGSQNAKTRMRKMNKAFMENSDRDYEIGIINGEQLLFDTAVYLKTMETLRHYVVY